MASEILRARYRLAELADPSRFREPLDIRGADPQRLLAQLRQMVLIRVAEEKIGDMVTAGAVRCPAHLGIGQEAVAVGISEHLRPTDRVFGAHRSHSHYFALGGDLDAILAEVLGKVTGCSRGMGGSMHLFDQPRGFYGSVPIVAGTVPLAVGAALAAKMDGNGDIAVAYFGDGAAEEGAVHESLNLASLFGWPVLFVVENNLFSSHLHVSLRQPAESVARFAQAHCIDAEVVDGNDVVAVSRAAKRLVDAARAGKGPGFLEAVTYRWRGHVGPREDIDVGVNRSVDLASWKKRDPVRRLADALVAAGAMRPDELDGVYGETRERVEAAWRRAEAAPYPADAELLRCVYAE
ncbi:MAG: thiamine pyrophosphate-dependent dehydrogenase E1 component subunit alpha [Burkholderiales bacterium]|nr:thiamine pyrophosphate-dependent dehydrogenase E1 component subunit alpha [Burkholderiales bacterium]